MTDETPQWDASKVWNNAWLASISKGGPGFIFHEPAIATIARLTVPRAEFERVLAELARVREELERVTGITQARLGEPT